MAKGKGSALLFIREIMKENHLEDHYLTLLETKERTVYINALAISRIEMSVMDGLFIKASKLLYPELPLNQGLRKIQAAMAESHCKGLYKILFKVITIPFLIKQVAKVWHQYNDTGEAHVIPNSERNVTLRVINYPDISDAYCESLGGYYTKMVEIAGGKNVRIAKTKTPEGCDWKIVWN